MNAAKLFLGLVLSLLLASPTWASSVGTPAAGNQGMRLYSQTFTASGSFTPTTDTIYVSGCGAGGGGAGGHSANPGGGGGGGGAGLCVSNMPITVVPGTALTITIGTAGVGGAAGANGGVVNVNTTIAGLPIGTFTIEGGDTAATKGTVTLGGDGGGNNQTNIASGDADGGASPAVTTIRLSAGGDVLYSSGAGAGGGATGPGNGGGPQLTTGYNYTWTNGGNGSGTKGGGGGGADSNFGKGGGGGSNGVGTASTIGYGAGGGGGAASHAGGNGTAGVLWIKWWQ